VAITNATYDTALALASATRGPDAAAFPAVDLTPTPSTCVSSSGDTPVP
jgi:hypothetical protein